VNRFKKVEIGEKDGNKNVNLGTIHFHTFTSFQNYNVLKCQINHTPTFKPFLTRPSQKLSSQNPFTTILSYYYDNIFFNRTVANRTTAYRYVLPIFQRKLPLTA